MTPLEHAVWAAEFTRVRREIRIEAQLPPMRIGGRGSDVAVYSASSAPVIDAAMEVADQAIVDLREGIARERLKAAM
jgi:hypothetical protein